MKKIEDNMESNYYSHQLNIKIQKRLKDLKGFYTHLIASFLIPPFFIFINLKTVPQFEWFWYGIVAWCIGLFIHWLNVFGFSKFNIVKDWEAKKIKETLNSEDNQQLEYIQAQYYIKAKKKATEIKGFYIHFFVTIFSLAIIIFVNLKFVPGFHFFWFALGGMFLAVFLHWLGVFGLEILGFGKKWEVKKTAQLIKKYQ